jgi:hypothetical protein
MTAWADLETSLKPAPEFFVQAPDGRKDWAELSRQTTLFSIMRMAAPRVFGYATANAGKRNPLQAKREGIKAGVFDTRWQWRHPTCAYVELKGYDARGRAGQLSDPQIEFGNRMTELGVPVACFFDPYDAADWLREQGFPVAKLERAA